MANQKADYWYIIVVVYLDGLLGTEYPLYRDQVMVSYEKENILLSGERTSFEDRYFNLKRNPKGGRWLY